MSSITDRELLAICNLCNLKLSFADIVKRRDSEKDKILEYHTIYSLLEGTIKAIKDKAPEDSPFNYEYGEQPENRKKDKDGKIVVRPVYEDKYKITRAPQDGDENTEPDRALVKTAMDMLKEEAGLLFGYFLQCKNEMLPHNFLDDWEIVYAGDAYKIITDYMKMIFGLEKPKFIHSYVENPDVEGEQVLYTFVVERLSENQYVIEDISKKPKFNPTKIQIDITQDYSTFSSGGGSTDESDINNQENPTQYDIPQNTKGKKKNPISEDDYEELILMAANYAFYGQEHDIYPTRRAINSQEKLQKYITIGFNTAMFIYDYYPVFTNLKKNIFKVKQREIIKQAIEKRKMVLHKVKNHNVSKNISEIRAKAMTLASYENNEVRKKQFKSYIEKMRKLQKKLEKFEAMSGEDLFPSLTKAFGRNHEELYTKTMVLKNQQFDSLIDFEVEYNKLNKLFENISKGIDRKNFYYMAKILSEGELMKSFKGSPFYTTLLESVKEEIKSGILKNSVGEFFSEGYSEAKIMLAEKIREHLSQNKNSYNEFLEKNSQLNILGNDSVFLEKTILTDLIESGKYPAQEKMFRAILRELDTIPFLSKFKPANTGFKAVILKNKENQFVVVFGNSRDSEVEKRLINNNFIVEGMYIDIVHKFVTKYKQEISGSGNNSSVKLPPTIATGFNLGGELANYYRIQYNCVGQIYLEDLRGREEELLNFNLIDMHNIFDEEYTEWGQLLREEAYSLVTSAIKTSVTGLLSCSFTFGGLMGGAAVGIFLLMWKAYGKHKLDKEFIWFFTQLCKRGFFKCNGCTTPSEKTCKVFSMGHYAEISDNLDDLLEKTHPTNVGGKTIPMKNRDFIYLCMNLLAIFKECNLEKKDIFEKKEEQDVYSHLHSKNEDVVKNGVSSYREITITKIYVFPKIKKEVTKKLYEIYIPEADYDGEMRPELKIKETPFLTEKKEESLAELGEFFIYVLRNQQILQENIKNLAHNLKLYYIQNLYSKREKGNIDIPAIVIEDKTKSISKEVFRIIQFSKRKNAGDLLQEQADTQLENYTQADLGDSNHPTEMIFAIGINPDTGNMNWEYKVVASKEEIIKEQENYYLDETSKGSETTPYKEADPFVKDEDEMLDNEVVKSSSGKVREEFTGELPEKELTAENSRILEDGTKVHADDYTRGVREGKIVAALENEVKGTWTPELTELHSSIIPEGDDYTNSFDIGFSFARDQGLQNGIKLKDIKNIPSSFITKSEELLGKNIFEAATYDENMGDLINYK